MKFETKIGLGEIVTTKQHERGDCTYTDELLKVVAIQFDLAGNPSYICRLARNQMLHGYAEGELIGDPDFDQEAGKYPDDGAPVVRRDREVAMEELLRSAHAIAERKGVDTAWDRFAASIMALGIGPVTARVYKVLPSDVEE